MHFAISCDGAFFTLENGGESGRALIAACDLASYAGLSLQGALDLIKRRPLRLEVPPEASISSIAHQFLSLCASGCNAPAARLPGLIYAKSDSINAFVDDPSVPLGELAKVLSASSISLYLLLNGNAGEVWNGRIPSATFAFHSNEQCGHSLPHIHICYGHQLNAALDIETAEPIAGKRDYQKIPSKARRQIEELIRKNKARLQWWWNSQMNGIRIDLDAALWQTDCSELR